MKLRKLLSLLAVVLLCLLIGSTGVVAAPPVAKDPATGIAVPTVAGWAGYGKLTFYDDFDSLATIDTKATGKEGFKWYVTRPYGASTLTTEDFSISDSVLTLKERKSTYNYGLSTVDAKTRVGWSYQYGYMETRIRVAPARTIKDKEGVPAIWSLGMGKLFDTVNHWVEVDYMEFWGNDSATTCLHDQTRTNGKITNWMISRDYFSGLGDGKWHTMGFLWSKGVMRSYLDGKLYNTQRWWPDEFSDPLPTIGSGEMDIGSFNVLDSQTLPLIISGAESWPMDVDWIRVWQSGGNLDANRFTPEKFIKTYATGANGEVFNEANEDNYKKLLSAKSAWNALSAVEKQGVEDVFADDSARTFARLLADAADVASFAEPQQSSKTGKTKATTTVAASRDDNAGTQSVSGQTATTDAAITTADGSTTTTESRATDATTAAAKAAAGTPWWYWGVPLIAVVVIGGIVAAILLGNRAATRSFDDQG